jgi:hypothetical protein
MRKGALVVLAVAIAATAPSMAFAKHKKKAPSAPPAPQTTVDPNEPGRRLVANGLSQIFVPAQSLTTPAPAPAPAAPAKKMKKHKAS